MILKINSDISSLRNQTLKLSDGESGLIYYSGLYMSFLDGIDPSGEILDDRKIEKYRKDGFKAYANWANQNDKDMPEESEIFNSLYHLRTDKEGKFNFFAYNISVAIYREGTLQESSHVLKENDLIILIDEEGVFFPEELEDLDEDFIEIQVKPENRNDSRRENPIVEKKITEKKSPNLKLAYIIISSILGLSLLGWGYIQFFNSKSGKSKQGIEVPVKSGSAETQGSFSLNNLDQDLTLIDLRIAQGEYEEAEELIVEWENYFEENPDNKDPEVQRRIQQLQHFRSLISDFDEELF